MRKTYDLKQVKISTSILWLLNKAETRNVFYNSMDIFSEMANLHLHSLIIRGLISGELYCAALSKLFPYENKPIRTKDFQAILDFIVEMDTRQLSEVTVIRQKNRSVFIENLTKSDPFEISEHLQLIDALMSVYLGTSDIISTIPTILGKLCDYRPNIKEPKKLLEIWFKSMAGLSLSKNNILDTFQLTKSIIIQENFDSSEKRFLDSLKFSDKIALIMSYESEALELEKQFIFDYSNDGSSNRDNVKHNFITVLQVFRKNFPKVFEDFKELMLVLNSSHIQISTNLQINIDLFIFEFFTQIEEISNHGNRTFRTGFQNSESKEIASSRTFRIENSTSNKDKIGIYHTMNKPPAQLSDKFSKFGTIGTYSGKIMLQSDYNSKNDDQSINWNSQRSGNNLLYTARKSSVPNGLNWAGVNKNVSANLLLTDGSLKSKFLSKKTSVDKSESKDYDPSDENKTSWVLQSEKEDKINRSLSKEDSNNQENEGPRQRINETRLLLHMKKQEIEGNRRQLSQQKAKERQLLSEKVFKDVAMGIPQTDDIELNNHRPKRVSDMKRNRDKNKQDLSRSRSQDFSKSSVEDINLSLHQIKSEISKLTSEQARLSAKIAENKMDNLEAFSPRNVQSTFSKEDGFENKAFERSSIRSMPISWHPYNNYGNEDFYNNFNMNFVPPNPYQIGNSQRFYPPPFNHYSYGYAMETPPYQIPQVLSINPHHTTKSLRDSVSSRPTSPGAMSEPVKTAEVLPDNPIETIEAEPLTIQNLMKHNKSMDKLPNNVIYLENNSKNHDVVDNKVVEQFSTNSFKAASIHSTAPPISLNNSIGNVNSPKEMTNKQERNVNSEIAFETSSSISVNGHMISNESPKVEIEANESQNKNDENSKLFFVSFGNENFNKKPPKKPKIRSDKETTSINNKAINSGRKSDENHLKNRNSGSQIKTVDDKPTVDKPLAFLIKVDGDQSIEYNSENNVVVKDKLTILTEKREQERKDKLEKIKEIGKIESEKRIRKELEKEKLKEEKKRKRDAIFEAHLVKKLEKESNDPQSRVKDVKIVKRPSRAVSVVPSSQRAEINNDNLSDILGPSENLFPDFTSINSKRDKVPINLPGPKLFVEPKSKSNKNVILNAIKYCCLAGKVNEALKQQTLEDLEKFEASHFMILMRGGCQYRSLYRFEIESECLTKLSGMGPKRITNKMVEKFFKYNSGAKKFIEITSTNHLSTVIDGITIYNTLWKTSTVLNSQLNSETSSQAEHNSQ